MTWDLGDLVPLQTTLKVNGVLTNATMALTVTSPAGVVSTPAVANPSTGTYTANVPATEVGDWLYVWSASGAATAVQPGQFQVESLRLRIVSLDEAKEHLNITTTTTDEELRRKIDAVTRVVEAEVGAVVPDTYTETITPSQGTLILSHAPVLSITSITAAVTGYTAPLLADLSNVYLKAGIVTRLDGGVFGYGPLTVVYRAGRQPIPDNIREAALVILAHLWRSQHNQAGGRPQFGQEDLVPVGGGYLVPYQAAALLKPDARGPAVA